MSPGESITGIARRSRRRRVLVALGMIVVLVAVIAIADGSGDDEPGLRIEHGDQGGFPLRGGAKADDPMIRKAADAWLADDAREDDDARVLDHAEAMRVLWAGRDGRGETVILAAGRHAALLTRRLDPDGAFSVQGTDVIRNAQDPRLVAFRQGVLVDDEAKPAFMPSQVEEGGVAPHAGFWRAAGTGSGSLLPQGALTIRNGLRQYFGGGDRTAPAAVVTGDPVSTWLVDGALTAKLLPGTTTFTPPSYQRFVAAVTPRDPADRVPPQWNRDVDPPGLRLVQDRRLPVLGPTMVLTAGSSTSSRSVVRAAHGGSRKAGRDEAKRIRLGPPTSDDAAYGTAGPPLAAALVDRATPERPWRDLSVFVAGGPQIATIEVLSSRETVRRPGPVAVVALPEATDGPSDVRTRGDLAVVGRTADRRVVVPSTIVDR